MRVCMSVFVGTCGCMLCLSLTTPVTQQLEQELALGSEKIPGVGSDSLCF